MYRVLTGLGALAFGIMVFVWIQPQFFPFTDATAITVGFWIWMVALALSCCAVVLAMVHAMATRRFVMMFGLSMLLPLGEFGLLASTFGGEAWSVALLMLPSPAVCVYGAYCWVGYRRALPRPAG